MQEGQRGHLIINSFQNFLKHSPMTGFNLKPDKDGKVNLNVDLSNYSQVVFIALSKSDVAQKVVDLQPSPIATRDLSLLKTLDPEKGFNESRTALTLQTYDTHFIEDFSSTELQTIDDMKKVKGVFDELFKI